MKKYFCALALLAYLSVSASAGWIGATRTCPEGQTCECPENQTCAFNPQANNTDPNGGWIGATLTANSSNQGNTDNADPSSDEGSIIDQLLESLGTFL